MSVDFLCDIKDLLVGVCDEDVKEMEKLLKLMSEEDRTEFIIKLRKVVSERPDFSNDFVEFLNSGKLAKNIIEFITTGKFTQDLLKFIDSNQDAISVLDIAMKAHVQDLNYFHETFSVNEEEKEFLKDCISYKIQFLYDDPVFYFEDFSKENLQKEIELFKTTCQKIGIDYNELIEEISDHEKLRIEKLLS